MGKRKVFNNQTSREDMFCADLRDIFSREITKRVVLAPFSWDIYECPICHSKVSEGNYCDFCGQHIVFPEGEEEEEMV